MFEQYIFKFKIKKIKFTNEGNKIMKKNNENSKFYKKKLTTKHKYIDLTEKEFTIKYYFGESIILDYRSIIIFGDTNLNKSKNLDNIKLNMIEKISFLNRNLNCCKDEKNIDDYRILTIFNDDIKVLACDEDLYNLETNAFLFMI